MSNEQKGKIIIDITENIDTTLTDQDAVEAISGTGMLKVINPSEENRLWNLKLVNEGTKEAVETNLNEEDSKDLLEAGKTWSIPYEISNLKEPLLKLVETIDTSKDAPGINTNFVVNTVDRASIKLELTNIASSAINNIKVTKNVPEYLGDLRLEVCDVGEGNMNPETKVLEVTIPTLAAEQTATIVVTGQVDVKNSEIKSGNVVDVTYEGHGLQQTVLNPSIEALTDTMTGIENEEDDQKPSWWNCIVEFENESDFEVTVKSLKITQQTAAGDETIQDISPSEVVAPNSIWQHRFSIESAAVPTLSPQLDFTTNYLVQKKILGKIQQIAKKFAVLETTVEKEISPPKVKANANTDMNITTTINNKGTANIDKAKYEDVIPRDFEPPTVEEVKCTINDFGGSEVTKLLKENAEVIISPEGKDTTSSHTITINFKGLDEMFKQGNNLVVSYPLIARNPQPNVAYETPVNVESFTKLAGPAYEDKPTELPVIGIQYVKRAVKTAKSISPAGENAFAVAIKISNQGGVELENITVVDDVPAGYNVGSFKPGDIAPKFEELGEKNMLTWNIARLNPGEALKLKYVSEGSGEFPRSEPQVTIAEPDSLKTSEGQPIADAPKQETPMIQLTQLEKLFSDFSSKAKGILPKEKVAHLLGELRDELFEMGISAIITREISQEVNELKKGMDKSLMGDELDEFMKKINGWKSRLM